MTEKLFRNYELKEYILKPKKSKRGMPHKNIVILPLLLIRT